MVRARHLRPTAYLVCLGLMSSRSLVRKDPVTDPERTGIIGTGYGAGLIISSAARLTRWLRMPRIRRRLDAVTGAILSGFGVRLGTET